MVSSIANCSSEKRYQQERLVTALIGFPVALVYEYVIGPDRTYCCRSFLSLKTPIRFILHSAVLRTPERMTWRCKALEC